MKEGIKKRRVFKQGVSMSPSSLASKKAVMASCLLLKFLFSILPSSGFVFHVLHREALA